MSIDQKEIEACEQCDGKDLDLFSYYGSWICAKCCAEDDADFVESIIPDDEI